MQNNNNIVLSVCISSFNRAQLTYKNVRYMLQYPHDDIEIVVSDNASEDNTIELLKTISDKRLRLFDDKENYGMIRNQLRAVKRGRGKYVCACNDRDCFEPKKLVTFIKFLSEIQYSYIMSGEILGESRVISGRKEAHFLFTGGHPGNSFFLAEKFRRDIKIEDLANLQDKEIRLKFMNYRKKCFLTKKWYAYNQMVLLKTLSWRDLSKLKCNRSSGPAFFSYEYRLQFLEGYFEVITKDEVWLYKGLCRWFLDIIVSDKKFECSDDFRYACQRYHYVSNKQSLAFVIVKAAKDMTKKLAAENVREKKVYLYLLVYTLRILIREYVMVIVRGRS